MGRYVDVPDYIKRIRKAMKARCYNPNATGYHAYGGRGIKVCGRWRDSVLAFFLDVGPRPTPQHSIERKDNDGDYCPENCYWATKTEQSRNRPSWNIVLTHRGKTACAEEHARDAGLTGGRVIKRLRLGWSVEAALTTPVKACTPMADRLEGMTKERLLALKSQHGTWGKAAEILGCPPMTFQRLRRKLGLTPPQRRRHT